MIILVSVAFSTYREWRVFVVETIPNSRMIDFLTFYTAGQIIADGNGTALYDVDLQRRSGAPTPFLDGTNNVFYNQPVVAIVSAPLTLLPRRESYLVFTALCIAALAATALITLRLLPSVPSRWRLFLAVTLFGSYPLQHMLWHGQLVPLTMLVFADGFWALVREKRWTGAVFGVGLLKYPFIPAAVLMLAFDRRWSALKQVVLAGVAMLALSLAFVGPAALIENARIVLSTGTDSDGIYGTGIYSMQNWRGFSAVILGLVGGPVYFGGIVLTAGLALATAVRVWSKKGILSPEGLAATVLLSWFTANQVHIQEMLVVWLALCFIAEAAFRRGQGWIGVTSTFVWFIWYSANFGLPVNQLAITVFWMLGLLALLWTWGCSDRPLAAASDTDEPLVSAPIAA